MLKSIFRFFLAALSIFLGIIGIFTLSIRNKALDSDTYKNSLSDNDAYPFLAELIETNIANQTSEVDFEGSFGEEGTSEEPLSKQEEQSRKLAEILILAITKNIDFENLVQKTIENNLDNFFAWANGGEDQIYIYFPVDILQDSISNANLIDEIKKGLIDVYDINSLPECTQEEIQNLNIDEISDITCKPADFDKFIDDGLAEALGEFDNENLLEKILINADAEFITLKTPVAEFIERDENADLENFQNNMERIQKVASLSFVVPVIFIFLSLLFALIVYFLGDKNFLKKFASVGIIMLIISITIISVTIGIKLATKSIINTQITADQVLDENEAALLDINPEELINKLKDVAASIMDNLFSGTLVIGVLIFIASLLPILTAFFSDKIKPDQKSEKNAG